MNIDRNYIRINTLSFNSIEIYMLFFLFICFAYIMLKANKKLSMKLICMYILALPYTDIVYRFFNIQISEYIIITIIITDIFRNKVQVSKCSLIKFMAIFSAILWMSTAVSYIFGRYSSNIFGIKISASYSVLNNIKYMLTIYMINRIIVEIDSKEKFFSIIDLIRFSGNITAITTIAQVIMYKMGFVVPGIFDMWGIPRAKGLSHEPGTNAFVLLTTMALSTIYVFEDHFKIYKMSLIIQLCGFVVCFSSGAIPIFIIYILLLLFLIIKKKMTTKTIYNIFLWGGISLVAIVIVIQYFNLTDSIILLINKLMAMGADYLNGTNYSGRGSDVLIIENTINNNFFFGIGAFNSTQVYKDIANTNTYIILFGELGIIGIVLIVLNTFAFLFAFSRYCKVVNKAPLYKNFVAYSIIIFLLIAWLRVLFFQQIWLALALFFILLKLYNKKSILNQTRITRNYSCGNANSHSSLNCS